jgi:DNA-binding HxlR family transcriptional regulator
LIEVSSSTIKRRAMTGPDRLAINAVLVSARQAIDLICDRWSLSVVLALLQEARRFTDITALTGMASRLLASRLKALEADGIVARWPYSLHPPRYEYRLTTMGAELLPVILHMDRWEQAWTHPDEGTAFIHRPCGAKLRARVECRACGRPAGARDIVLKSSRAQPRKAPEKTGRHRRSIVSSADQARVPQALGPSLDVFGDKWGIEILLGAFFRIHHFNDLRDVTGISSNILSDRLERLVAAGLLTKGRDPSQPSGYWLTAKGVDAYAIIVSIHEWADKWARGRYRSPVRLVHAACGETFLPRLTCSACERPVRPEDVGFDPGNHTLNAPKAGCIVT